MTTDAPTPVPITPVFLGDQVGFGDTCLLGLPLGDRKLA